MLTKLNAHGILTKFSDLLMNDGVIIKVPMISNTLSSLSARRIDNFITRKSSIASHYELLMSSNRGRDIHESSSNHLHHNITEIVSILDEMYESTSTV